MGQTCVQHPNAALNANARRKMVDLVLEDGWSVTAAAQQFQVDPKTVRKWRDRFLTQGAVGLLDRPSTPHNSPNRTSDAKQAEVLNLRLTQRRCAAHIANTIGLACSTVQKILNSEGMGQLNNGDRATRPTPTRYVHDIPGDLVHVDVKKNSSLSQTAASARALQVLEASICSSTLLLMTTADSLTQRYSTTKPLTPPHDSGIGPRPGSLIAVSAYELY